MRLALLILLAIAVIAALPAQAFETPPLLDGQNEAVAFVGLERLVSETPTLEDLQTAIDDLHARLAQDDSDLDTGCCFRIDGQVRDPIDDEECNFVDDAQTLATCGTRYTGGIVAVDSLVCGGSVQVPACFTENRAAFLNRSFLDDITLWSTLLLWAHVWVDRGAPSEFFDITPGSGDQVFGRITEPGAIPTVLFLDECVVLRSLPAFVIGADPCRCLPSVPTDDEAALPTGFCSCSGGTCVSSVCDESTAQEPCSLCAGDEAEAEAQDEICNDGNADCEIEFGFTTAACGDGQTANCDDNCPEVFNPGQEDEDGDQIGDACDECRVANRALRPSDLDPDGDGLWNECDTDDDGDGLSDLADDDDDNDGLSDRMELAIGTHPSVADTDDDGASDLIDNCPLLANADQEDTDGDQLGNVCDNCPLAPNADQSDGDFDQVGDVCDNCPLVRNEEQSDRSGVVPPGAPSVPDGIGDVCQCGDTHFRERNGGYGEVNLADIGRIQEWTARGCGALAGNWPESCFESPLASFDPFRCDVNGDDLCNNADVGKLKSVLAGGSADLQLCAPAAGP